MIPHRIQLAGFLSYKDAQEVPFEGAPLWMLAGSNGSGKSSIFDGVTYALFGSHRGGSQAAAELINKDSPSLSVEFDFRHDGELVRARRTLKRTKTGTSGTQQLLRHTPEGWAPVPDTNLKTGFDRWVRDHIGLTYDTFTSSVLLLQGRAEKLLDASPKGRAEVLAGIVDLERYQKLHERANTRKLEHKATLDTLGIQRDAVPEVGDLEYAAAAAAIDDREVLRETAVGSVDAALQREQAAGRWAELQARVAAADAKLAKATGLLGEADRIGKRFARLRELRDALPAAYTVVAKRGELIQSEAKADKLAKDRQQADDRRRQAEAARDQARQKRDALRKQVEGDEAKRTRGAGRLAELSALLEAVKLAEDQQAEFDRLAADLKKLPADPEGAVRAAHDTVERLTELGRVLPILERFQTERHELREAARTEAAAAAERDAAKAAGLTAKATHDKLVADRDTARAALTAAEQKLAVTQALAEQAKRAAAEFATLTGAKDCRACGQPLTPHHFAAEKTKREAEAKAATAAHSSSVTDRQKAATLADQLTTREAEVSAELLKLREQFADHARTVKTAQADAGRLAESLRLRYAELAADFQRKVAASDADLVRTHYPERDELIALRDQAGGLAGAKRGLLAATDTATKARGLKTRLEQVQQALDRLRPRLGGDPVALRKEHADLKSADTTLANAIKAGKLAADAADRDEDTHGREAHVSAQRAGDLAGQIRTEEEKRKLHAEAADRALAQLPDAWKAAVTGATLTDYHRWAGEQSELEAAGIEATFAGLEAARGQLAGLRQDAADARTAANAVPESDRLTVDAAKALTVVARQALAAADKELRESQRHKGTLDGHREQRAALGEQQKAAEAAFLKYKTLSDLLGRDRLQRHLVRTAERQIVDYANAVLDRLSGGQLFLRLAAGDDGTGADRALELECVNRVAGGSPILVAFLSGSQKFRVAVALALGIGQYASRQHRPIESVIIDEGFGCLDRAGRQVMIQELQNLRGHLHCILLVSHQEEFADAFPDGYRFALKDGATAVTRFER